MLIAEGFNKRNISKALHMAGYNEMLEKLTVLVSYSSRDSRAPFSIKFEDGVFFIYLAKRVKHWSGRKKESILIQALAQVLNYACYGRRHGDLERRVLENYKEV